MSTDSDDSIIYDEIHTSSTSILLDDVDNEIQQLVSATEAFNISVPTTITTPTATATPPTLPLRVVPLTESVIRDGIGSSILPCWSALFTSQDTHYRVLIREKLRAQLHSGDYTTDPKISDATLFLQYKPTRIISDMFLSIVLELMKGDTRGVGVGNRLKKVLRDPDIYKKEVYFPLYVFVECHLKTLIEPKKWEGAIEYHNEKREGWGMMLNNKMSFLSLSMEHTLMKEKDWKPIKYPPAAELYDVEWLLKFAEMLQATRMRSAFPNSVSKLEKAYVKKAHLLEPTNPFVILALLETIAGVNKKLSVEFETQCKNLVNRFSTSCYIRLKLAKIFLLHLYMDPRCYDIAMDYLRGAVNINRTNSEANFLCAKYLCGPNTKPYIKNRNIFLHIATSADLSNHEAFLEYFCYGLGSRDLPFVMERGQSRPTLFDQSAYVSSAATTTTNPGPASIYHPTLDAAGTATAIGAANLGEKYHSSILNVLRTSVCKAWPEAIRLQLVILSAFNYYLLSDFGEALETLLDIYKNNQVVTFLANIDMFAEKYRWDNKLTLNKFKNWLKMEYNDIVEVEEDERIQMREGGAGDGDDSNDDENVSENAPVGNDLIKIMLAYLLQIL